MPEAARVFFALRPPAAVRDALGASAATLAPPARRVDPADFHLTLAFVGVTDELASLRRAGREAAAATPAFTLHLERFGRWRRGIAWAAPASVPPGLAALQEALAAALATVGRPLPVATFRPHVTLARRAASDPAAVSVPAWRVHALTLMASGPPPPPRYRDLDAWELRDEMLCHP